MSVHPIEYRYGSKEMRAVWEFDNRVRTQLAVEVALAKALAKEGKIPRDAASRIANSAKRVKTERVLQIENKIHHDVMALAKALAEKSGDAGKYVHLTATSYDIVDTALALQTRDALRLVSKEGKALLKTLIVLSKRYKKLVMVGRTHGQHATPITLGFKFANYADKIGEDLVRLEEDEKYLQGKFSGAVGSYAAQKLFGAKGVEKNVMKSLHLPTARISTQVVARENFARILSDVAILASSIDQIAKEIRNLQRTEIGEVSEGFAKKQVGSSTMAQKKNPINCENICANARVVRSCVIPALENIALEHERDLTNSACERSIFPTAFVLLDDMILRMDRVLKHIVVDKRRIAENLKMTDGRIMAEAIITYVVKKGGDRQKAHERLRKASMKKGALRDNITGFSKKELDMLFNYNKYVGDCEKKVNEVVRKWG